MLQGMTGFGQAQARLGRARIQLELKSLNHKFFEAALHLPEGLMRFEEPLKNIIAAKVRRGRVNVALNISGLPQEEVVLNKDIARRYFALLRTLKSGLKIRDGVALADIIHLPGVFALEKKAQANQGLLGLTQALVKRALAQLIRMRMKEGRAIAGDLTGRIKNIQTLLPLIKVRCARMLKEKRRVLSLEEFEAYQKSTDVTEELLRLGLHLKNFLFTIQKNEAVGKELDFIAQELQREANTIGAKSQDGAISGLVIKAKTQVEKIREQVQNVE